MTKGFGISDLASLGFGQVGQLLDTMDMMSKTWSGMALPAALDPTASLEELDKRIGDLRAIEQWLALNQNMLRSTIQGLEVQRGTIAALQSFGKAMGVPEGSREGGPAPWDPERLAALFAAAQGAPTAPGAGAGGTGEGDAASASPPAGDPAAAADAADDDAGGDASRGAGHADATQLAQAWWNMLNQQFQQLAGAAVGGMAAAGEGAGTAPQAPASTTGKGAAPGRRARPAAADGAKTDATATGGAGGRKRAPRSP